MTESVRAVERSLDVQLCFTRQTPELSITQIAEQVGIHKSTVHRLLATLEKKRFVQRNPDTGMYRLGIRLLQMAYLTLEQNDLHQVAAPFLRSLGQRLPAFAKASGKAILAFMPEKMVRSIPDRSMPQWTPYTHNSPNTFFEDWIHSRNKALPFLSKSMKMRSTQLHRQYLIYKGSQSRL